MVYSSLPTYLDPSNWQQQPVDQSRGSGSSDQLPPSQLPPPSQQLQQQLHAGDGGNFVGGGSIRPGSMAERARLANIPMPEAPLKCPRCESTNTKFCYFNNYSLTQPRHFCKSCRRYWTRGGALRSVPVGGGCRRRNSKRSKAGAGSTGGATSKSPCSSSTSTVSSNSTIGGFIPPPHIPALRFLSPLGVGGGQLIPDHYNLSSPNLMSFWDPNFQTNLLSGFDGGSIDQQFPFLGGSGNGGGLDSSNTAGLHQFQGLSILEPSSLIGQAIPNSPNVRPEVPSSSILTQQINGGIKMEENQSLNLSRQMMIMAGISRNDHPWTTTGNTSSTSTSAWNDFTTFSTSSTSYNPL